MKLLDDDIKMSKHVGVHITKETLLQRLQP